MGKKERKSKQQQQESGARSKVNERWWRCSVLIFFFSCFWMANGAEITQWNNEVFKLFMSQPANTCSIDMLNAVTILCTDKCSTMYSGRLYCSSWIKWNHLLLLLFLNCLCFCLKSKFKLGKMKIFQYRFHLHNLPKCCEIDSERC